MPAFNYERAAAALVDAAYSTDRDAAKKHDVSERSIQRWRKRLDSDSRLAAFVARKRQAAENDWADELSRAITSGINFLDRAGKEADASKPGAIHAIAGAVKLLSEIEMTRRVLDARLSANNRQNGRPSGTVAAGRHRRRT